MIKVPDNTYVPLQADEFDASVAFMPIYEGLSEFDREHPDKNDPPNLRIMQLFLNKESLRSFFAWYLSQDLGKELIAYQQHHGSSLPRTLDEFAVTDQFMTANRSTSPKPKGTHPLSRADYLKTKENLEKEPILRQTFQLFDAGMIGYLACLKAFLIKQNGMRGSIAEKVDITMQALENGAFTKAIVEELGPAIAFDIEEEISNDPSQPYERIASESLIKSVKLRSAFHSISNEGVKVRCPFEKTIQALFDTGFNLNSDGSYSVLEERTPAGLMTAIIEASVRNNASGSDLNANHI